jgi:hypothetical protein
MEHGGYRSAILPIWKFWLAHLAHYKLRTLAILGQITLFLQMLKFSKDIFFKEHIFVKG